MQLHFVGRHFEVTEALKNYTQEKLISLEKLYQHINNVHITFKIERENFIAEATLHAGFEIHASAESDDMYKSIDKLIEKLNTQLKKYKDKIIEQHQ